MPDIANNKKEYRLRARLPQFFRIAAVAALAVTIFIVAAGFYNARSRSAFKLKSEHTQLSTDVVAEISGYERLESDGGLNKYFVKADYARTFSDNHQELQNVYLEIYDAEGAVKDRMNADSALYIPEEAKNFTAYLKDNVRIETSDGLKVRTGHITYKKSTETAESDEAVEFERETVRGRSFGATVKMAEKRIDLLKDVEIEIFESPELARANVRYAKINSGAASFDQAAGKIELNDSVNINLLSRNGSTGNPQTTDTAANRAMVTFTGADAKSSQLNKIEFFDNVRISTGDTGGAPTNIESAYALYDKPADRFELKGGAHIATTAGDAPTDIRSTDAVFEQSAKKLALTGGATVTQGGDYLNGDVLYANLFPDNRIKDAVVRGNASARQTSAERVTTISAPELNAAFDELRALKDANAIGASRVLIVPQNAADYTQVTVTAVRGIGMIFKGAGLIDKLRTDGRTTIQLDAPGGSPDAANKRVTADTVTTFFNANGKDITKAEAIGNAELYIEPHTAAEANYRTTIKSPRFDCEFYPTGNNARLCIGSKTTTVVRVPTMPADQRGTQTLAADKLSASFGPSSSDIETLDAVGNAKFSELDRHAIGRQMTYTQADEMVRIRGGEPTVWDARARGRAREIDWDTRADKSYLRGGVSTTYYSQKQMGNAAPFGSSDKPVFVTGETAEFDHRAETASYRGNARGWQDDNYVRGDTLFIDQTKGRLTAEGNVQSLLYNARIKQKAGDSTVPVYAAAKSMTYDRDGRLLQYRTGVDIRQGPDRITAGSADVYLTDKNEVSKTIAETNVVLTQPGRRGTGDWAQYTADDEVAILRGNPATVTDAENGSSQGGQMTFYLRDNRVVSEAKTKQNTSGRSRSVYKVKNQ